MVAPPITAQGEQPTSGRRPEPGCGTKLASTTPATIAPKEYPPG